MKNLKVLLLVICCLNSISVFAQTPKSIEADLVKSFNKIEYWSEKGHSDTSGNISWTDSLEKANDTFGNKLYYYTNTFPFTLFQKFKKLHVNIIGSADGKLRIYSWDTELGGTEHDFRNIIQYKSKRVSSILNIDTSSSNDNHYVYYFSNIYTLTTGDKTYYLGIYNGVFSTKDMEEGVQIFCIENEKLNTKKKLIKTASGIHNSVSYIYDYFSIPSKLKDADIHYNPALKTFTIPRVGANDKIGDDEKVSTKHINYKFTGQYFEKVK